jgi:hypothetical protein
MKAFQVGALDANSKVMGMSYARNEDEVLIISKMYQAVSYSTIVLDIELPTQFNNFTLPKT